MGVGSELGRGVEVRRRAPRVSVLNVVLWILVLAGLAAWIDQIANGLVVTNMRDITSWGLGITGFMLFDGISAGALMLAAGARLFRSQQLRGVELGALITSLVTIVVAGMLIITDLGNPQRFLNLFLYPTSSPMTFDVMAVTIYIIFEIVYLWALVGRRETASQVLAAIGLPVAVAVHTIGAMVFAVLVARPFANTALLVPLFLVSALISGAAVVAWVTWWQERRRLDGQCAAALNKIAELLALAIPVSVLLTVTDLLTYDFQQGSAAGQSVMQAVSGTFGWELWLELALFAVAFVALLFAKVRARPSAVLLASTVALAGVVLERVSIMATGFSSPLLDMHPGVALGVAQPEGTSIFAVNQIYYPSLGEWALLIGVLAFGLLLLQVFVRIFARPRGA